MANSSLTMTFTGKADANAPATGVNTANLSTRKTVVPEGGAAGEKDALYSEEVVIPALTTITRDLTAILDTIDCAALLPAGGTLVMYAFKNASGGGDVIVRPAAANGFNLAFDGDLSLPANSTIGGESVDGAGWGPTAAGVKDIDLENTDGSLSATVTIQLWGRRV